MPKETSPSEAMANAMDDGDLEEFCRLGRLYPAELEGPENQEYWFFSVAKTPHVHFMAMLLDKGIDVNMRESMKPHDSAISSAVGFEQLEMSRFLLSRGADPTIERPIIAAINIDDDELSLKLVQLLVEHGANVNTLFDFYDDKDKPFTALDWASGKPAIAAYLKSNGAKTAEELRGKGQVATKDKAMSSRSPSDQVVDYFDDYFGPVDKRSLIEIVPTEPPIAVHVIPSSSDRKHITLFTTGMSARPMHVPGGEDEWKYAELFIQLPGDWKYAELGDPKLGWPILRLRSLAKYPHQMDTWLGGPVTVVSNDDPPRPIAPNARFDALLLMAEHQMKAGDGRIINLYRMTPLYPEERELEARSGIKA